MLTLFHAPQSRSSRIVWLLEELGASYELRIMNISRLRDGTGKPDPSNPHPDTLYLARFTVPDVSGCAIGSLPRSSSRSASRPPESGS